MLQLPFLPFQERLMTLALSATISFLSLNKTGFNVNVPDPDEKRRSPQHPENSRLFPLTSLLFHFCCVLFRVASLAYFFATVRGYTAVIVVACFGVNAFLLAREGASYNVTLLLGAVSIFMPNGYLLYNFAATFPVDFSFDSTK